MKILTIMALAACFSLPLQVLAADSRGGRDMSGATQVRMAFEGGEVLVEMYDTPVAKDFISLLPLTASFEDYARTEKITYLPRKLKTEGASGGKPGDFTYYAPWGNLAVFYKGNGSASGLHVMGRIVSGKETLTGMDKNFSARLDVVE